QATEPLLLRAWLSDGGGSVAVVPIVADGETRAVLAIRRGQGTPIGPSDLRAVSELVEPYVPGLELLRRSERTLFDHAFDAARGAARRLREGRRAKVLAGAAVLGLLWLFFGALPNQVYSPGTVVALNVRHFAAPFDGRLRSAPAVSGSLVRKGEVLATLDSSFQELELAQVEAQLASNQVDLLAAMAIDDGLTSRRLELEREGLEARASLIRQQIDNAELRAPFDGVVLTGDVRDRVGDTLTRGEPLFDLAPAGQVWVELEISERAALEVEMHLQGTFAPRARPELHLPVEVVHVGAALEASASGPVLRSKAELQEIADWLRPGMRGTVRLRSGWKAPWRMLLGRPLDMLRMRFIR
ncbi:MAG: HlyD family efflux transporter periplasmic adaptor subunit, partial [Planctomycetota bacterium]